MILMGFAFGVIFPLGMVLGVSWPGYILSPTFRGLGYSITRSNETHI